MGGHQIDTEEAASGQAAAPRSFLFLQGPISDFFDRLGRTLLAHLARLAVERGCGRLEWAVLDWNRDAIGFYESRPAGVLISRLTNDVEALEQFLDVGDCRTVAN